MWRYRDKGDVYRLYAGSFHISARVSDSELDEYFTKLGEYFAKLSGPCETGNTEGSEV
jgi:hypothetical protein